MARVSRSLVAFLLTLLHAAVGGAAVDLTGDWYFGIDLDPPQPIQIVQSGTSLSIPGTATGTIDPDTGVFTLFSDGITEPPSFCGFVMNGQADAAGNIISGTGLIATTSPECPSIGCACQDTIPFTFVASRGPCGNGVVDMGEVCDGGHLGRPGDCCALGCGAIAQPAGASCLTDFNACTADVCDAAGACTHAAGNAGTICRNPIDSCDIAETCDGVSPMCPADGKHPDGTPCSDLWFCNGEETGCQGGFCVGGTPPCAFGCDELADMCLALCPSTPSDCRIAEKSLLIVKGGAEEKDKLIWKWTRGEATSQEEFADPTEATDYALCVYAGTAQTLVADYLVPHDSDAWEPFASKGFRYKELTGAADGITRATLLGSAQPKSKVLVRGKGTNLPDLPLPLAAPVSLQLVHGDSGLCWGSTFTEGQLSRNDEGHVKGKAN